MRVAVDITGNIRRGDEKRILPERRQSNALAPNPDGGHRMRSDCREVTVGTVSRSRAEAVDWQRHGAVMLSTAAATCRNGLLRLHEGQSKSGELQEQHQTGKRPSHEEEIVLHREAVTGAGVRPSTLPGQGGRRKWSMDGYYRGLRSS